ncbi:MAG: hypothetical protein ACXVFN_02560 [Solirubrobacteraceae bacterium]
MFDVDGDLDTAALARTAERAGLGVEGVEVTLRGTCADCRG